LGMTERPHMHSHLHGERMANSMPIRRRRKTAEELAAMQPEDRFMYEAANPMTDEEQYAALRREMDGLEPVLKLLESGESVVIL